MYMLAANVILSVNVSRLHRFLDCMGYIIVLNVQELLVMITMLVIATCNNDGY